MPRLSAVGISFLQEGEDVNFVVPAHVGQKVVNAEAEVFEIESQQE